MYSINIFENLIKFILILSTLFFSNSLIAADDNYSSQFINQSKMPGSKGYVLVKTRTWPESGCIIDSGKDIVNPGEATHLTIAKKQECDQAGIGYSFYKAEDTKKENLLGYVSHRFRDGKFSLQVSVFCEGDKCIFRNLNPDQKQ